MRRLLGIGLVLASLAATAVAADTKSANVANEVTTNAGAAPQWRRNRYPRRIDRTRVRSFTRQRVVRYGRRLYRETYVVSYYRNGRTDTRLISRVRIS